MHRDLARRLRRDMTDMERFVWDRLRHRQLNSKFRRQAPIGNYIVDFVCYEAKLILELDGGQHADDVEYDSKRTAWLKSQGCEVLRFWNCDIVKDWDAIERHIGDLLVARGVFISEVGERK